MARGGCGDRLAPPRGICRCGGDREERKGGAGGGGRAGKGRAWGELASQLPLHIRSGHRVAVSLNAARLRKALARRSGVGNHSRARRHPSL